MVRSPKGIHDMLYGDIRYMEKFLDKARAVAEFYGFLPIEIPHLEHTELFSRPLGETSEVVEKQMYSFRTRGGDSLTLRPEGTASVMRAYQENGMSSWPQPVKLYYHGSFFRHENPQRGRFREFRQFGIEVLGEPDAIIDALVIKIFYLILTELGFKNILVHINSIGDKECRPTYKKELANYYKKKFNYLCKDCKIRFKDNPLRMLDCKEPSCIELRTRAPQMIEHLCDPCKAHLTSVLEFLDEGQIGYVLDNYLVRGFDYYGRTVFEIFLEEEPVKPAQSPEGIEVAESLSRDNFRSQLKIAAKVGAKFAVILGQKEAMDGSVILRDMTEGVQETIMQHKLVEKVKARLLESTTRRKKS